MSGVSIGYFTPEAVVVDVDYFIRRLSHRLGPPESASFPLTVRSIKDHPLAYAKVDGHIPIHIDPAEGQMRISKMFHFVFQAENRPILLTGRAHRGEMSEAQDEHEIMAIQRTRALLLGHSPVMLNTFTIGATELVPGMVVHFDIAENWHGITAGPGQGTSVRSMPRCLLVQMCGYEATDLERAVDDMTKLLAADRPYWNASRRDKSGR